MHAQFSAGSDEQKASDFPPGQGEAQAATSVLVEGQRVHARLAEGSAEIVPFGPSIFAPGYGMLKGRFDTYRIIGVQAPA